MEIGGNVFENLQMEIPTNKLPRVHSPAFKGLCFPKSKD